jgi:ankyrin repeat protein
MLIDSGKCDQRSFGPDMDGRTPLHYASIEGDSNILEILISYCDISLEDGWGETALDVAGNDYEQGSDIKEPDCK